MTKKTEKPIEKEIFGYSSLEGVIEIDGQRVVVRKVPEGCSLAELAEHHAKAETKTVEARTEQFDPQKQFFMLAFVVDGNEHKARIPNRWLTGTKIQTAVAIVGTDGKRHMYRNADGDETTCGEVAQDPNASDDLNFCTKCFVIQ